MEGEIPNVLLNERRRLQAKFNPFGMKNKDYNFKTLKNVTGKLFNFVHSTQLCGGMVRYPEQQTMNTPKFYNNNSSCQGIRWLPRRLLPIRKDAEAPGVSVTVVPI